MKNIANQEWGYTYEDVMNELQTPNKDFTLKWRNTYDKDIRYTSPELVRLKQKREALLVELATTPKETKTISRKIVELTEQINKIKERK
jgi:hypothetical protein